MLRHIRKLHPAAIITLAVSEKVLALARPSPYVDEVVGIATSAGRSVPRLATLPRGQVMPLRSRFDMTINLYRIASRAGRLWIRLLIAWSGIGRRKQRRRNVLSAAGAGRAKSAGTVALAGSNQERPSVAE